MWQLRNNKPNGAISRRFLFDRIKRPSTSKEVHPRLEEQIQSITNVLDVSLLLGDLSPAAISLLIKALAAMLIAALKSAASAKPQDLHLKMSLEGRLFFSQCLHCEHIRDVIRGSTLTTSMPFNLAL